MVMVMTLFIMPEKPITIVGCNLSMVFGTANLVLQNGQSIQCVC